MKLGREKKNRLDEAQNYGFITFVLRNDVGANLFLEVAVKSCFEGPPVRQRIMSEPELSRLAWVEV